MIALFGVLVGPGLATVTVLEAQGLFFHDAFYPASSHSPCAGAIWSHDPDDGTAIDWQHTVDWGCLYSQWRARCDPESLFFSGHWEIQFDPIYPWGSSNLGVELSALIQVSKPTLLTASRSAVGDLSPAGHTVLLTLPDETTELLLGTDIDINQAERLLPVGTYRVTITVDDDFWVPYPDVYYDGLIMVNWKAPVGAEASTWGGVKSLYR